jgi:superfamily II DNA or RNA helicase
MSYYYITHRLNYTTADELCSNKTLHYVHGGVKGDERNDIRALVEESSNALIVASYGTFSTGINIKNLSNVVFGSPSKSKIRVLQSIGRGLRLSTSKDSCKLYDIVDDIEYGKWTNFTLKHYADRVKLYNEEQFAYSIHKFNLKE